MIHDHKNRNEAKIREHTLILKTTLAFNMAEQRRSHIGAAQRKSTKTVSNEKKGTYIVMLQSIGSERPGDQTKHSHRAL